VKGAKEFARLVEGSLMRQSPVRSKEAGEERRGRMRKGEREQKGRERSRVLLAVIRKVRRLRLREIRIVRA
jgi:hypothetical protein